MEGRVYIGGREKRGIGRRGVIMGGCRRGGEYSEWQVR